MEKFNTVEIVMTVQEYWTETTPNGLTWNVVDVQAEDPLREKEAYTQVATRVAKYLGVMTGKTFFHEALVMTSGRDGAVRFMGCKI